MRSYHSTPFLQNQGCKGTSGLPLKYLLGAPAHAIILRAKSFLYKKKHRWVKAWFHGILTSRDLHVGPVGCLGCCSKPSETDMTILKVVHDVQNIVQKSFTLTQPEAMQRAGHPVLLAAMALRRRRNQSLKGASEASKKRNHDALETTRPLLREGKGIHVSIIVLYFFLTFSFDNHLRPCTQLPTERSASVRRNTWP